VADKTAAQFDAVFDTKIAGLFALLEATEGDPLRLLCVFSSTAARSGNVGQSDYAMANEALNRVAAVEARRRPAAVVKSIGWGPWEGGMVTPSLKAHFEAAGVPLIGLAQGAQMFVQEIAVRGVVESVIGAMMPAAAERLETRIVSARGYPFLRDHAIGRDPVFPVALATAWFVEIARTIRPEDRVVACRDVRVLKGIELRDFDGGGQTLELRAVATQPDRVAVEIRSPGGVVHYRAEVVLADGAGAPPAPPGAPTLAALAPFEGTAAGAYKSDVLFHGPSLQAIQDVTGVGEAGMSASLLGAGGLGWEDGGGETDVALIDGALQLAILWTLQRTGSISLPTAVGAYSAFAAPPRGAVTCVLQGRKEDAFGTVSDVSFVDADGRVVAALAGVRMHALGRRTWGTPRVVEADAQ
jgi:hypothetical protein